MSDNANYTKKLSLKLTIILTLTALTMSSVAIAADATGPGVSAVSAKLRSLSSALRKQNFQTALQSVPQWTPSGGVFQFFAGSIDMGAIYWSQRTGAHIVYGAILHYWAERGYETDIGYPTNDETAGTRKECLAGTTSWQGFVSRDNLATYLCWDGRYVTMFRYRQ
jgi:hypothetical protein